MTRHNHQKGFFSVCVWILLFFSLRVGIGKGDFGEINTVPPELMLNNLAPENDPKLSHEALIGVLVRVLLFFSLAF